MRAIVNCLNTTGKTYSDGLVYNESTNHNALSAPLALNDADGLGATGWSFDVLSRLETRTAINGTQTFYDPNAHTEGWLFDSTPYPTPQLVFTGLDNAKTYDITFTTDSNSSGTRQCDVTVAGTPITVDASTLATPAQHQAIFTGVSPSANQILINLSNPNTIGYVAVIEIGESVAGPSLQIDSTPTDINSQTQESSVVSTPATAPTSGNTEVKLDDDLGPAATVNSVSGADPYTINYTFPRTTAKKFSATGYPLYHEVDAENATSGNVPYLPIAGQDFIDLSSPVNTAGTLGETYTGSPAATGDQWVFDTTLTGDATITLDVDAQGYWILSGTPSVTSTASFYRIDSAGTVDVEDTITFTVGGTAIPSASRVSVFHIANALRAAATYTHTQTNEIVVEWLESEGISRSALNQMLYGYLGGLGYTGTLQDRMIKWSRDA